MLLDGWTSKAAPDSRFHEREDADCDKEVLPDGAPVKQAQFRSVEGYSHAAGFHRERRLLAGHGASR
jgi:hypothetical protein